MSDFESLLRVIFPSWLFDYFDFVKLLENDYQMDVYLDEKKVIPEEYKNRPYVSHGFTDTLTIQDFPLRGKNVFLHIRRRKWLLLDTHQIITVQYDIAHDSAKLTNEFVDFLKDAH